MPYETGTKRAVVATQSSALPSFSAAAFLLVTGLACYAAALRTGGAATHLMFYAFAVGLSGVGLFALALRIRANNSKLSPQRMFSSLYGATSRPAFLTDMTGTIEAANAASRRVVKSGPFDDASQFFDRISDDGPALLYRLLVAIGENGVASEVATAPDGSTCLVSGVRTPLDKVIWNIMPNLVEKPDAIDTQLGAAVPVLSTDKNGGILTCNPAAQDILGERVPKTIEDFIAAGTLSDGSFVRINNQAQDRARICRLNDGADAEMVLFLPVNDEEVAGALPEDFMDALPVGLARISPTGEVIYANDAARNLIGPRAVPGTNLANLIEGLGRSIPERIAEMMRGRTHMRSEVARCTVDGQEVYLQVTLKRLLVDGDASLLAVISDATEFKALEAQFVQSQKMQAVGQLAGGVAHDFNNLLTAISGHCDLLLLRHDKNDTDYNDLIQISQNAMRAAALVGKLLAFSRKQTLMPKVINLYDTLVDLKHLLNRLLGEKVVLRIEHGEDLPAVRVDERQLEQVIMNLVVNARDAMPNGGEVTIRTHAVHYDRNVERDGATIPFGDYLRIDVTDTGIGIPDDKVGKIFEPFYTTKGVGEGTGLGLSTAYGIIKQTGGFIFVASKVGSGTTFTLLLPVNEQGQSVPPVPDQPEGTMPSKDLTGRGVVLLVEDEIPVRSFAARALSVRGYTVLEASSAEEALEILKDEDLHVDIIVSDVIMPGMDGPSWVRVARETRPDAKVVFVSGYAEDVFEDGDIDIPNATFLPKPFSLNELTHTVKECIGT